MVVTRSPTIDQSYVQTLSGLSAEQIKLLEDHGVKTYQDLTMMEPDDFDLILGTNSDTFIVRKRLIAIVKFIRGNNAIEAVTTMQDVINASYHAPIVPNVAVGGAAPAPMQLPVSAPIKLSPSDIPSFSGNLEDQERYRTKIEAIVGQTTFKFLLSRAPADATERERDEELFNVFKDSFHDGTAYHLVTSSLIDSQGNQQDPSGHRLWKNFLTWCNSGGRKDALIKQFKNDLKTLKLDGELIDGFTYVNTFITKNNELRRLNANVSPQQMMSDFVDNIEDEDFSVVKEMLQNTIMKIDRGEITLNQKEFFDSIESRQRMLNKQAEKDMEAKSRRAPINNRKRGNSSSRSGYQSSGSVSSVSSRASSSNNSLSLPPSLYNSLNDAQKKGFQKFRNKWQRGEKVDDKEIAKLLKPKPSPGDDSSKKDRNGRKSRRGKKKKTKKSRALKVRRATCTQSSETTSEDVRFLMRSDESSSEDEDITDEEKDSKKVAVQKIARKINIEPLASPTSKFKFQTILDSGTEWTVIGGQAWTIAKIHTKSLDISAVSDEMDSVKLKLCDAVTAVADSNGDVQLLGVLRAGYSPTLNDGEAVVNTHLMREAGIMVDATAKRHGGKQRIDLDADTRVPLEYDATKYKMYVACRAPTHTEMETCAIRWIDCHIEDLMIDDGQKPVRRDRRTPSVESQLIIPSTTDTSPELISKEGASPVSILKNSKAPTLPVLPHMSDVERSERELEEEKEVVEDGGAVDNLARINWKMTLGYCPDQVVSNTLRHTTQYFTDPIESEVRAYPIQHRKKRLLPLHVRRIPGRSCADTFFSSIRSVRGFTCVQLFAALFADYVWVKCLRRESQVPGSYQDFCTEVGAPNELLTDNSKVQSGKRFTQIDKNHYTKHNFSTPHCQNQNPAERKIQDVKHRSVLVLYAAKAPLVFWCYAVTFVVDCLNHTSKVSLKGKTPVEVLCSNTPDISVFRYEFWQPIEYLDPGAKYPACKWKPGRFIGIARDHGDPFTYIIWTEPEDGGWKKGSELIRNVVRPRVTKETIPLCEDHCTPEELEDFELVPGWRRQELDKIMKKRKTKKRRNPNAMQEMLQDDGKKKKQRRSSTGGEKAAVPASSPSGSPSAKSVTFASPVSEEQEYDEEMHDASTTAEPSLKSVPVAPLESEKIIGSLDSEEPESALPTSTVEVSNELDPNKEGKQDPVIAINGHRFKEGRLQLRLVFVSDETQWVDFRDVREDYPRRSATYIVNHYKSRSKKEGRDRVLSWAKKTLRDCERAVRRIARLYDFVLDDDDNIRRVRRVVRTKKKSKFKSRPKKKLKYGVQVPNTVQEALELDELNGDSYWRDAIKKEMDALMELECFEFRDVGDVPGEDFQKTRLHMIFDVKTDLRRKARLVAGGHLVELFDTEVYSSTVKGISVKLLHVISHQNDLKALCGDVGNAFVTAFTKEKVYCIAGLEFGAERKGQVVIIRKALYGLASSAACFHAHFGDTLRSFGFTPTRFDNDVWIRLSKDKQSYEYICSHVDDFCIFAKDPQPIMDQIKSIFTVKSEGPPEYYLGNDFRQDRKGRWCMGCRTYIKEGIKRIEAMFGSLLKRDVPMVHGDHPELDDSEVLGDEDHTKYQMLIGMLNWIVTLGRIDIAFAVSSLSRFVACPRKGHMNRALYVFGYLKKKFNRRIVIDSRDPILVHNGAESQLDVDLTEKLRDQYPDAKEQLDPRIPKALFDELAITAYVDSDHAHDKVTRRSITGLIIFVGRTPVLYMSRRQGSIETSTYGAEFCAMKTAVEEVMSVRYMLRCLGVKVTRPTYILGDNKSVILNATVSSSLLKKKHVAIAYHMTREASAAGICHPLKTKGTWNYSDVCTKAQVRKIHGDLVGGMMC